jgi:hypothetical protein
VGAKHSEGVPAATRKWPSLPSYTVGFHDVHNSQPRPILSAVDTDETPVHADTSTNSCTEHVPADLFRTGTIRKKIQMDKFGETSQNRKHNRTRTPVSTKEKYYRNATPLFALLLSHHMDTLRIATLNINGLLSPTRQNMLDHFVRSTT